MARGDPQINVRLKPERHAVLQAAAFVHDTSTTEMACEAVESAISRLEALPSVKKALEARAEQAQIQEAKPAKGKVSQLPSRRSN